MGYQPFSILSFILLTSYILLSIVVVYCGRKKPPVRIYSYLKGLLMPTLLLFYLSTCLTRQEMPDVFIMLGIIFGFIGDVVLENGPKALLFGLLAFLMGHVFYIIGFVRFFRPEAFPGVCWLILILYVAFASLALPRLLRAESAKGMVLPLTIYLITLCSLNLSALMRLTYASLPGWLLPLAGSLLFIASDTMLAFHIYHQRSDRYVMITYTLAQLLLVAGAILG